MRFDPKVKPRLWNLKTGMVVYNCFRMGLPMPVLAMPMWEGAGNRAYDYSGNQLHGIFPAVNIPVWQNNGIYWDGGDRAIAISNTTGASPPKLTFSGTDQVTMWQYLNGSEAQNADWSFTQSTEKVLRKEGDKVQFILNSFTTSDRVSSIANFSTEDCTIAGVFDGVKLHVYLDGVGASVTPSGTYANPSVPFCIGGSSYDGLGYPWTGLVYVTCIFNVGLNQFQIQTLHNNPYGMFEQVRSPAMWSFVSSGGETFYKTVTGTLPNPDGTVNTILLYKHSVYGNVPNTTSSIVKDIGKGLVGSCPNSEGNIVRSTDKNLDGSQPNPTASLGATTVQQKSILGDTPEPNATLSSRLVGNQSVFGNIPNAIGVIVKRISKYLVGGQPTSQGIIIKGTGKHLTGNQPNATSNVKRKTTTRKTGIMGTISGTVSSILNPAGPGIVKLYRLIGSSLKKFIG